MWKLLLVDDEASVIQSISTVMDWPACGVGEVRTCQSAVEALRCIREEAPDIVITDIKMPVMNGIQLIEQAAKERKDMEFIILSGYDDFEFAQNAMGLGVRHYLLKPCGEEEIVRALEGAGSDLERRRRTRRDAAARERMELELARQCIRLSLRGDWGVGQMDRLPSEGSSFWFLSFACENEVDAAQAQAVYEVFAGLPVRGTEPIPPLFWTGGTLGAFYICRDEVPTMAQVVNLQKRLNERLGRFVQLRESGMLKLGEIPDAVDRNCGLRGSVLLLEAGGIKRDQRSLQGETAGLDSTAARVERAMASGNRRELEPLLRELFVEEERGFCTLVCTRLLLRRLHEGVLDASRLTSVFNQLYEGDMGDGLIHTLCDALKQRSGQEGEDTFVDVILRYLQEHLSDPGLSLKRIAREVVFRSEDYVGKVFSQRMGVSFTQYLNTLRIERAKYLIGTLGEDKLYTVAEQIGLGNNPQYFSKLFKRHTGYTPREYRMLGKK